MKRKITESEFNCEMYFLKKCIRENEAHIKEKDDKRRRLEEEVNTLEEKVGMLRGQLNNQEDMMTSTRIMMYRKILKPGKEYIIKIQSDFLIDTIKIKVVDVDGDMITYTIPSGEERIRSLKNLINTHTILKEVKEEKNG